MEGTPAAKISFNGTNGFSDYQELEYTIPTITGVHSLYLKFTGGEGYLLNADSFVFGKEAVALNGKLIKNVKISDNANPQSWNIGQNGNVGSLIFGDRTFTIASLPEALKGAEILMTSCDAKGTIGDTAEFTATEDIDLYVALDSRVENTPDWLDSYKKMCDKSQDFTSSDFVFTTSNDLTFIPYKKTVKTGEKVVLGSNGQSYQCVNFTVFAVPASEEPPIPVTIKGDINKDGKVGVSDIVLIQKHLLNIAPLTSEQSESADMDGDKIID